MLRDFKRLAIVNRGEAAMRLIHAVREFNLMHGLSIRTIALYTEPDRHSMYVREADESVCLGSAMFVDPRDGHRKSRYFDYARIEQAFEEARVDAAWVGWGFVAEQADFADLCDRAGVVFVGPDGDTIRRLGDKVSAKRLAEEVGVPVPAWNGGPAETAAAALAHAEQLGFPLMLKASAGGGGRGIRRVKSSEELEEAFASAQSEALKAFADSTVFLEELLPDARHVEVQIMADRHGTAWAVGLRDCSLQRRHQKVIEESRSVALSDEMEREIKAAAVRLALHAGYTNAGTVEFLYDPATGRYFFLEVNTRLQVEHPVTEMTTGLDLVKLQLHVARGGRLEGEPPAAHGHAIEVRLNAEDPDNEFTPSPGRIVLFREPTGPGIRVDTGVETGDVIAPEFDSMVAKLIAYGATRDEALSRLGRALRETSVVVENGTTNKAFLLELLDQPDVRAGNVTVGWLDSHAADGRATTRPFAAVALVQAAILVYEDELALEQAHFYEFAARGRAEVRHDVGRVSELRYGGNSYPIGVFKTGPDAYRVDTGKNRIDVAVTSVSDVERRVTYWGRGHRVLCSRQGAGYLVEVDGVSHRISRDDQGVVRAPAPAVVVGYSVAVGDTVSAGDVLVTLEAMKMEVRVRAPLAGVVQKLCALSNVQVNTGDPLVQIDPAADEAADRPGDVVRFEPELAGDAAPPDGAGDRQRTLAELKSLLLGYDVDPAESKRIARALALRATERDGEFASLLALEDEVLETFVDNCALFSHQPALGNTDGGDLLMSEQYLLTYLRTLSTEDKALPDEFVRNLRKALSHYGIADIDQTGDLRDAMFWLFKAHERVDHQIEPISSLLRSCLHREDEEPGATAGRPRALLDRLIAVTQGLSPLLSDLAREVRYVCFDRRLYDSAQQEIYDRAECDLADLAEDPHRANRAELVQALVDCPEPLFAMFLGRFPAASSELREAMLEVLVGRYYRIRDVGLITCGEANGRSYATASYVLDGARIHPFAVFSTFDELDTTLQSIASVVQSIPASEDVILDLYLWRPGPLGAADAACDDVRGRLDRAGFERPIRHVAVAIAGPDSGRGMSGIQNFTYRPGESGYQEDALYRGVHPMMAKRMNFWRLSNFAITRLPSPQDVYVYHGIAKENPKDERLFAVAEVRAMTIVRDAAGRAVELPHLERMLLEALAAIRRTQSQRKPRERLHWNRVVLYVWPRLDLEPDEIAGVAHKLAPAAEGIGIDEIAIRCRMVPPGAADVRETVIHIARHGLHDLKITYEDPPTEPLKPLNAYELKVLRLRRMGMTYPYEIIKMLTPARTGTQSDFPHGDFVEYDLDDANALQPVDRPYGQNKANIIVGVIRNFTAAYPEGMTRVLLLGDPSREMGSLAEAECRRIMTGIDLAEQMRVPLEWFPVSAGAKISMESGTENMDWIARVLRRLIDFTQEGGEVNLVVNGINVGAQPYWNAEATMLMHTRGILVMTPEGAMVLTGKRALDFSGSVSAADNFGIGGYEHVMGPNGQAQYWARDLAEATHILFRHYEHTYVAPGERFPRRVPTKDAIARDVRDFPHGGSEFAKVGDVFSDITNPGRKKPFEIRRVMQAAADADYAPLERWVSMRDAENAIIWDAHVGGYPVCMIGFESHQIKRLGIVPADGPESWTSGTLFPQASRKIARALNAASGNRPVVILANLSGFDGSPESLRKWQLEYGAEIGRAVVNFDGPIIFCVVSRYHGGAFVVFSRTLNENFEAVALEGTYASVIGGSPAAAVVFAREVDGRTHDDPRVQELERALEASGQAGATAGRAQLAELYEVVHSEKLGQVAEEFDAIHSVQRALRVGSLDRIIAPETLRPYLVDAIERGIAKTLGRTTAAGAES
ncbi:MAG TPA: biotin carboxylase N-terminal domain-containing protein [Blastocatellia bacterium]|nr:biotin carboxylase N-terminal domain-containing protein [Blastocatellia bacterium]